MCIFLNVVWNFTGEGLLSVLFETYPKFSGLLTHDNSISRWVIENLENRETFPCCLRRCTYLSTHQWPFALAKPYRYRRKCDTHNLKQQIQPTNEIFIMPSNNKKPCRPVQETYNLFISWKRNLCISSHKPEYSKLGTSDCHAFVPTAFSYKNQCKSFHPNICQNFICHDRRQVCVPANRNILPRCLRWSVVR